MKDKTKLFGVASLTKRELGIMKLVLKGLTSKEIAKQLDLSFRTVQGYRATIMLKTGASNVIDLLEIVLKEREDSLKKLSESEMRFHHFLNELPAIAFIKDADGKVIFWNRYAEAIHDTKSWPGRTMDELFPKQVAEEMKASDALAMQNGAFISEDAMTDKHGVNRIFQTRKFRIQTSENEVLIGGVSIEITELRSLEKQLRASEQRYKGLLEDQSELISRFLADGTITFVNDAFCRFFGKTEDEIVGRSWAPRVHAEDLPMILSRLAQITPENPVVRIENRVYGGDGKVYRVQFINRGFFDSEGKLTETQSVGREITQ